MKGECASASARMLVEKIVPVCCTVDTINGEVKGEGANAGGGRVEKLFVSALSKLQTNCECRQARDTDSVSSPRRT